VELGFRPQSGRDSGPGHLPTALGALRQDFCTGLTVVVIVLFALLGTLLAEVRTEFAQFLVIPRVAGHESRVQRRDVGYVPAEPDTAGHVLALVRTGVGTPLTDLGGLEAVVDTLLHLLVRMRVFELL